MHAAVSQRAPKAESFFPVFYQSCGWNARRDFVASLRGLLENPLPAAKTSLPAGRATCAAPISAGESGKSEKRASTSRRMGARGDAEAEPAPCIGAERPSRANSCSEGTLPARRDGDEARPLWEDRRARRENQ